MAQMPDIKPQVNREPEDEKKKGGGLLGRLFGGGSGGGALGGGAGAGGFGGAAAGGGLLATKAGMLALILVGTTVAGGIGMAGYKMFGPGSEDGAGADNLQLFAPKPKQDASANGQAAPADGSSESLNALAKANRTPAAPAAAAAEAPKDAGAAGAAADDKAAKDAAAAKGDAPLNAMGNAGSGASKLLKNSANFKGFSSGFGGSGGGSGASASVAKTGGPATEASAARNGATSGLKGKGAASNASSRAVAGRRANKALGQAFAARNDGRGAQSSYAAGRTFDGSAANNGGAIGPDAGAPGMDGPGDAAGQQPKSLPNTAANSNDYKAPPTPTPTDAAPWQNSINTARAILGVATLLLLVASMVSKVKPYGPMISKIIGFVVAGLGALVIALGAHIATGQYGQKLQGGVLAAAGAGLVLAGMMAGMADNTNGKGATDGVNNSFSGTGDATAGTDAGGTSAFDAKEGTGIMGMNPFVALGGGVGLIGLAGSMMVPLQKYPSQTFQNGNPPDDHWFGYQELPSETALKKMVA